MTRLILAFTLLLAALTNAAVVTVLYVVPARVGRDGSLVPTLPAPTTTQSGYSEDFVWTRLATAVGTAESGLTKYEIKDIQSRLVIYRPDTTQTIISEPETMIFTVEQGAGKTMRAKGGASITLLPSGGDSRVIGVDMECVLDDAKEKGVCTGVNYYPHLTEVVSGTQTVFSTSTETVGTTYTGNVLPIATLTTSNAQMTSVPVKALIAALIPAVTMILSTFII